MKKEHGYQPTPEEVGAAEGTMSETQKAITEARESLIKKYEEGDPGFLERLKNSKINITSKVRDDDYIIGRLDGEISSHHISIEKDDVDYDPSKPRGVDYNDSSHFIGRVDGEVFIGPFVRKIWDAYSKIAEFKIELRRQIREIERNRPNNSERTESEHTQGDEKKLEEILADLFPNETSEK